MRYIEIIYGYLCILLASKRQNLIYSHTLNRWEWPFKFLGNYYKSLPNYTGKKTKYSFYHNLHEFSKNRNTQFENLRYHNVEYRKAMTESEFFTWYWTDGQLPMSEAMVNLLKVIHDAGEDGLRIDNKKNPLH